MEHSRPLTDYKRTTLAMECIKRYQELSVELMEILDRVKNPTLSDAEVVQLNIELENMIEEINELMKNITFYNGQNNY